MSERMSVLPRRLHKAYALFNGYFWLPCPLCGRESGGHEWRDRKGNSSSIYRNPDSPGSGKGICPACTRAGLGDPHPFGMVKR